MDRNATIVVIELGDELGACAEGPEGVEVLTQRRDPYVVGMLELGDREVAPLEPAAAIVLFGQRASAARQDWDLSLVDRDRLDAMLARIDRLPLTIEMAAARLGSMTFDDIVDSLDAGAPVLQVSHRSSGHRHRNLDSLVNWSVGLLPDEQRQVFENCCVFAGPVTAEDASVVLDTGSATVVQLADLAERSLLAADLTATPARYRMLQTVRSSVTAGFESSGRAAEVRARHARHFSSVAAHGDRRIRSTDEHSGRRRLEGIVPELRAAQRWALAHDPVVADALCTSLHLFTYSSFWNEPEEWARALLATDPPVPALGASALVAGAEANRGEHDQAMVHAQAALTSHDPRVQATAWEIIADVAIYGRRRLAGQYGRCCCVDTATFILADLTPRSAGVGSAGGSLIHDGPRRCFALDDPRPLAIAYTGCDVSADQIVRRSDLTRHPTHLAHRPTPARGVGDFGAHLGGCRGGGRAYRPFRWFHCAGNPSVRVNTGTTLDDAGGLIDQVGRETASDWVPSAQRSCNLSDDLRSDRHDGNGLSSSDVGKVSRISGVSCPLL